MKWILVATVVLSTVLADLLQSAEMKRHGEVDDFGLSGLARLLKQLARKKFLILAVFFMTVSFFAFLVLLSVAELSFAVPATAASVVLETILARVVLKENIGWRRWVGAGLIACGVWLVGS